MNFKETPIRPITRSLDQKKYHSPFDQLPERAFDGSLAYKGTLHAVVNELSDALVQPESNTLTIVQHPPRIIRATVDYKIAHPDVPGTQNLVQESINLGLAVYKDPENSIGKLSAFKEQVEQTNSALLDKPLIQKSDYTTWDASRPERSQRTAEELAENHGENVLFVALAHGGVAAGMDVYLRYRDMTDTDDSAFYAVRASNNSSMDRYPQLTPKEKAFLEDQAQGREVIVFDEDQATGVTLEKAEETLREVVHKPVRTIANMGLPIGYFSD